MLSNRDSNGYIVVFLLVMVFVVAVSLSLMNSVLKPTIDRNVMVDKKTQILKSVITDPSVVYTDEYVLSTYKDHIKEFIINNKGEIRPSEGDEAFDIDLAKMLKEPEADRKYPVFKYTDDNGSYYIFPLSGLGLWDKIWGYVSVEPDFNTIRGTAFDHKGETPGLGARITEDWFRNQFHGDKFYDDKGDYALTILKGNNPEAETSPYKVDGVSGATLTSNGVNNMLKNCIALYKPFFDNESKK